MRQCRKISQSARAVMISVYRLIPTISVVVSCSCYNMDIILKSSDKLGCLTG